MIKAKGSTLLNRLQYAREKATPAQMNAIVSKLNPGFQKRISLGIMPADWYPFEDCLELMTVIDQVMGKGDLALVPEIGYFAGKYACQGIYKIFFKIGTVEFILKHAPKFWEQLYDHGRLSFEFKERGWGILTLKDLELPKVMCLSLQGWSRALMELAGAKNLRLEIAHWPKPGEPDLVLEGRWDAA
jgi:hypothetical protein